MKKIIVLIVVGLAVLRIAYAEVPENNIMKAVVDPQTGILYQVKGSSPMPVAIESGAGGGETRVADQDEIVISVSSGTATLIAANTARRIAIFQPRQSNTSTVYVRSGTEADILTKGVELAAGQPYSNIYYTGAYYIQAADGAINQDVVFQQATE